MVIVQKAMDPQVSVVLGMKVLQELDRFIKGVIKGLDLSRELGPLYWKGLPNKSNSQAILWRVFCRCRTQAEAAELQGGVGKIQVPPTLPIKIGAGWKVVKSLPMGTHHSPQGVTRMVEPMLQKEEVLVGHTICTEK